MTWIIGTAAAVVAFFGKGLTGFANTLIFSSIMSFFAENRWISPVDLILSYPSNFYMTISGWREIRIRVVLPLVCALTIGMLPGALILRAGDDATLKRFLGLTIVGLAIEMFFRSRQKRKRAQRKGVLLAIGIVSGFFFADCLGSAPF